MNDNYPEEYELQRIRDWPIGDAIGLLEYVESLWMYPDYFRKVTDETYLVSTGGWSGNEEIIEAMMDNFGFWVMCWFSSRTGGHYQFRIPKSASRES